MTHHHITFAAPIPKGFCIFDIKHARGFFEWYKKRCEEDPDYGKARAKREAKKHAMIESLEYAFGGRPP